MAGPANGVTPVAPPADWTIFGVPFGTSPNVLGVANAFTGVGCGGQRAPSATSTQVARSTSRPGSRPNEPATRSCHCRSTRGPAERPSRSCVRTGNWSRPTSFATPPRKEASRRRHGSTSRTRPVLPALRPSCVPCRPVGTRRSSAASTAARRTDSRSSPARPASTACSAGRRRRSARGERHAGRERLLQRRRRERQPILSFVAAKRTGSSDVSPCVVAKAANDQWPTAFGLTGAGTLTTQDVIDAAGQSKWYAFDIQPGSEVRVNISNLPADYDLALFKDITQAYTDLTSPQDLTRLSAEYAPSIFSPSIFSPSIFSPSIFSPDAYAPSIFSPSIFSPSIFSPSIFSPSIFSPSIYSPSIFSAEHLQPVDLLAEHLQPVDLLARASSARASSARTPLQAPRRGASSPPRRHPARPTSSSSRTRGATRAGTTCGSRAAPARSAPTARTR